MRVETYGGCIPQVENSETEMGLVGAREASFGSSIYEHGRREWGLLDDAGGCVWLWAVRQRGVKRNAVRNEVL